MGGWNSGILGLYFSCTKESIIENTYLLKISPTPSFPKRGNPSLWKREVRRDFIKQCRYDYGPINNNHYSTIPTFHLSSIVALCAMLF